MAAANFRVNRALIGFMSEAEMVSFIQGSCVLESPGELESYRTKWSAARRVVQALKPTSLSSLDQKELSREYEDYINRLRGQDVFKATFPRGTPVVRELEISKLVAFQKNLDIHYAADLASRMRENDRFVLETCLPLSFRRCVGSRGQDQQNCPSLDQLFAISNLRAVVGIICSKKVFESG